MGCYLTAGTTKNFQLIMKQMNGSTDGTTLKNFSFSSLATDS